MIFKLNMFLREWEGYDKVYEFFKKNLLCISSIKLILYLIAMIFIFIPNGILRESMRIILYSILFVLEYFFSCIYQEKKETTLTVLSCILMLLAIFIIITSFLYIIVSCL